MDINVGNIVRLKKDYVCEKFGTTIRVADRTPLQVIADGIYKGDKEYCVATGNGFNISIECNELIKVKEKGEVPTTILKL